MFLHRLVLTLVFYLRVASSYGERLSASLSALYSSLLISRGGSSFFSLSANDGRVLSSVFAPFDSCPAKLVGIIRLLASKGRSQKGQCIIRFMVKGSTSASYLVNA